MDLYPDVLFVTGVLNERALVSRVLERLNRLALSPVGGAVPGQTPQPAAAANARPPEGGRRGAEELMETLL